MKAWQIVLIVCGVLLLLLILFIVFIRVSNKKRFNRLQENLQKLQQEKEDFDNDNRLSLEDNFSDKVSFEDETDDFDDFAMKKIVQPAMPKEEAFSFEESFKNFESKPLSKEEAYRKERERRDRDFQDFLNEFAYSRKILDKNLVDKLRGMPPEIQSVLLGSVFEKIEDDK